MRIPSLHWLNGYLEQCAALDEMEQAFDARDEALKAHFEAKERLRTLKALLEWARIHRN